MANSNISKYYVLFDFIEHNLVPNTGYEVVYAPTDKLKEGITAVYLTGGTPLNRVLNGTYLTKTANVTLNIQSFKSDKGILDGYSYCEGIIEAAEKISNYTHSYEGKSIVISHIDIIGDVNYIGGNPQGIPTFSINMLIRYN